MGEGEELARHQMLDGLIKKSPGPKPFLKWVGGKRQLVPELLKALPLTSGQHYYEPFLGGGALFFALRAQGWRGRAALSDANEMLIRTYLGVRNDLDLVLIQLKEFRYSAEEYYLERERFNKNAEGWEDDRIAASFIYLNKTGFNGLWRVNKKGEMNVPMGTYLNPLICDKPGLTAAAKALKGTTIRFQDFEKAVKPAETGDLVYFDPPYVPVSATANFTAYSTDGFTHEDQMRLRDCAIGLKRRGVHVVLSNADVPAVRKMYAKEHGFDIRRVEARRAVNSNASKRGHVGEVIIT